jgi:ATP-dependent protease ClpP protease subunit
MKNVKTKQPFSEPDYEREHENEDVEEKRERIRSLTLENISESASVETHNGYGIHTLVIAGQIEGHYALSGQTKSTKYEHVLPQLVEVEEKNGIDGLLVILNTVGGDVEAGLAISEMIAGMSKPTVSLVLGGGHSIGVPLAVSTKRSFIVPSATMTIHPVRTNGLVIGVPQTFTYFLRMQERILDFIVCHSNIDEKKLRSLMLETDELASDIGSVIDGREAVKIGLIDEVGSLGDALGCLRKMINENKER